MTGVYQLEKVQFWRVRKSLKVVEGEPGTLRRKHWILTSSLALGTPFPLPPILSWAQPR